MSQIVIVKGEDWEGLYLDGELDYEGHEVQITNLIPHTPIREIRILHLNEYGCDSLEDFGCLPNSLREIPRDWFYEYEYEELEEDDE